MWCAIAGLFRSRAALQAEILVLRHQLNVLRRRSPKRAAIRNVDRLVFVGLYRLAPKVLDALKILRPETVVRWHRAGFRAYWRWKSRPRAGRPQIPAERTPCGGHRGFTANCSSPGSMSARPQLRNTWPREGGRHLAAIARLEDIPSQPSRRYRLDGHVRRPDDLISTTSYGLLVLRHSRRELLWLGVTAHPTAEWIASQLTEACGWSEAPRLSFAIAMAPMAALSFGASRPSAYALDRLGKMGARKG
jgi:hypothetical protein